MTPVVQLMKTRPLGKTGFAASRIGIGDIADRNIPLAQCVDTIRRAMDLGMNLIDTAPAYEDGYSEEIVGAALKGRRDEIFVIDKVNDIDAPVAVQVEASLKALGISHADLFKLAQEGNLVLEVQSIPPLQSSLACVSPSVFIIP